MLLSPLQILTFMTILGSIYCTSDVSNPTPVYVVQGGEAVLQCGFESSSLTWQVYNGGSVITVATGADTVDGSKYSVSKNPSTGLYYRLLIKNVGVSDLKKYRCNARIVQHFYLQLDVLVAPSISVSDVTYDQNEATIKVECDPVGIPSTYTFYRWQHKSKYGVLIREFDGEINGVLTLPNISVEDRYQDSGEYVCTAGNGIVGKDGKIKQTGSGYVTINAQPIFTNDNRITQHGEKGENAVIAVYAYSVPKYSTSRWYKSNTQVPPSTKYIMSETPAIVNDIFHGKDVQLDGYSIMLTINDLTESDFNAMYTLQLSYGANQTVQYSVSLESEVIPESSEGAIGGLGGGIGILIIIIIGLLYSKRRHNTRSNSSSTNRETHNMNIPHIYSEIADVQEAIPIDTSTIDYESLGKKDKPNVYGDLKNKQEPKPVDTTTIDYEPLGKKDKPNVYEHLTNKQEPISIDTSTINYESLGKKDKPKVYEELENKQEPTRINTSTIDYESLGKKDKPNVYEGLRNKQDTKEEA